MKEEENEYMVVLGVGYMWESCTWTFSHGVSYAKRNTEERNAFYYLLRKHSFLGQLTEPELVAV